MVDGWQEKGRSYYDMGADGDPPYPPYIGTPKPEKKLGSWGQIFSSIKRETGLHPLSNSYGTFDNQDFQPLQDVTEEKDKAEGFLEYRSALPHQTPHGIPGLLVQTINPDEYQYLFYPLMTPLYIDGENGKRSTRVCELDKKNYPKYDEAAGLHAALRVKQLPGGAFVPCLNFGESPDEGGYGAFTDNISYAKPPPGISQNINQVSHNPEDGEGKEDSKDSSDTKESSSGVVKCEWKTVGTFKGMSMVKKRVCTVSKTKKEEPKEKTVAKPKEVPGFPIINTSKAIGLLSWQRGGPIVPGGQEDQHTLGLNEQGEPCTSGHIWTNALFYRDKISDGPLDFSETPYPTTTINVTGQAVPVYCSWDNQSSHPWAGLYREGKWKWWTVIPNVQQPQNTRIITKKVYTRPEPVKTTKYKTPKTKTYTDSTAEGGNPEGSNNDDFLSMKFAVSNVNFLKEGVKTGEVEQKSGGKSPIPWDHSENIKDKEALTPGKSMSLPQVLQPEHSYSERSNPAMMFTAIRKDADQLYDFRFGEKPKLRRISERRNGGPSPYTLRFQGFGKINTSTKKWEYTEKEGKFYELPTSSGGVWITPPEVIRDGDEDKIGTTSTSVFALHPDMTFAFGYPKTAGNVDDGPYFETAGSSGSRNLSLKFKNASDTARDGILNVTGQIESKERSGTPTLSDGYFSLYIDTTDSHAYIAWNDGGTARSLDLGQVT